MTEALIEKAGRDWMTALARVGSESRRFGKPVVEGVLTRMVGLTLGLTLAGAGVETLVLDRQAPTASVEAAYDGRASAIARGSQLALETAGLWRGMAPQAQPILDIRVSDGRLWEPASPLFLHYDHREVGDAPFGFIVENLVIRKALNAARGGREALTLLAPAELSEIARKTQGVEALLQDGRRIKARLVVSAEGRKARLRAEAGIRCAEWSYPQTGIVCTIAHSEPHHGVAHEHFLPAGPFAVLPMVEDAEGRHRSSIVWTERRELAEAMLALDDAAFAAEMQRRFGDSLGDHLFDVAHGQRGRRIGAGSRAARGRRSGIDVGRRGCRSSATGCDRDYRRQ